MIEEELLLSPLSNVSSSTNCPDSLLQLSRFLAQQLEKASKKHDVRMHSNICGILQPGEANLGFKVSLSVIRYYVRVRYILQYLE